MRFMQGHLCGPSCCCLETTYSCADGPCQGAQHPWEAGAGNGQDAVWLGREGLKGGPQKPIGARFVSRQPMWERGLRREQVAAQKPFREEGPAWAGPGSVYKITGALSHHRAQVSHPSCPSLQTE